MRKRHNFSTKNIVFFEQKRFSAFQDEISEMDEDLFRAIVDDDDDVDC